MDYATALKIVTWAANEYHYLRATGLAPSRGTPYSMEEVEEAVEFMSAPRAAPLVGAWEYHPPHDHAA